MTTAVAVLNSTFEPVGPTRLARAIAMIMRGEAVIEESDPHRRVRAADIEYPMPLVIRLLRFVKVPVRWGPAAWTKAGVLERDGYKCAYCKKKGKNIVDTVDHILPRALGGRDRWENTVACCARCNGLKDNRMLDENRSVTVVSNGKTFTLTLQTEPTVPMRLFHSNKPVKW